MGGLTEPARILPGVDVEPGAEDRELAALSQVAEVERFVDHQRLGDAFERSLYCDCGLDLDADFVHTHLVLLQRLDDHQRLAGRVWCRDSLEPAQVLLLLEADHREEDPVEVLGTPSLAIGDGADALVELEAHVLITDGDEDAVSRSLGGQVHDGVGVPGLRVEPGSATRFDLHGGVSLLRVPVLDRRALTLPEPLGQNVQHAGHADAGLILERAQGDAEALGRQEVVDRLGAVRGDTLDLGDLGHVFAKQSVVAVHEDPLLIVARGPGGRGEAELLLNSAQCGGDCDRTCGAAHGSSSLFWNNQ